jgi:hypothetical protein
MHQLRAQAQQQAPAQQQQPRESSVKTAPIVKSLVALQREKCTMEKDSQGCFIKFFCSALAPGEATAYFRASGTDSDGSNFPVPQAEQVSTLRFEAGNSQSCRLFLCSNLDKGLEGFEDEEEKYQLVLDLQVVTTQDPSSGHVITAQRSIFKFTEDGTPQVVKQLVQCGSIVRCLDALYGTLPNPKHTNATPGANPGSADEGGDCVICLCKPREVVILHCRHVCLCMSCAKVTSSTWSFQCPVCRGRVAAMVGLEEVADGT